jgi:hypothetical protein
LENNIEILDIIQEFPGRPYYILLNRKPIFKYSKQNNYLIAEDNGMFDFFRYKLPKKGHYAFFGLNFDILLKDDTIEHAYGQWWDEVPKNYNQLVYQIGYGTINNFNTRVYQTAYICKNIVKQWILTNNISNDPWKYYLASKLKGE